MTIKDLKVGSQLRMGFGIVLLLIVMLSSFAWWQTYLLVDDTRTMYEHPLQVRKALAEMRLIIANMRLEYRNYLLTQNDAEKATHLKKTQNLELDARRQMDIFYDRYLGPEINIDALRYDFVQWVELRNTNLYVSDSEMIQNAMKRLEDSGDIGIARQKMMNDLQVIDDFSMNKSMELLNEARAIQRSFTFRLIAIIISTFLLAGLLIIILLRNIKNPIYMLKEASERFNNGETSVRSLYESKNEFGDLSKTLNKMFAVLDTDFQIKNKVSAISSTMLQEDDADLFCQKLLQVLMENTDSQMGAFYLLNESDNTYRCFKSIGVEAKRCRTFSAEQLEGEFGMALSTGKMQYLTEISSNTPFLYPTVSGYLKPSEMLTIPIHFGTKVSAILSLLTIKNYHNNDLVALETLMHTINARTNAVFYLNRVVQISEELEKQNGLLETQKYELSELAAELTQQNEELEVQKIQLDEANKLKSTFLSRMSHELRTPLNSVIALSGVLGRRLQGKVSEEEYSYLDVIERNGKHLLDIINDILDIARIESGREEVDITTFNLCESVKDIVDMIQPQAALKNIQLKLLPCSKQVTIHSDYDKCLHIIQNILSNAVKFTEKGGVTVEILPGKHSTEIKISDTGIGMDADFLPHIFDEFRQADERHSRKNGGTGLGMAIAQKYAQMLGGTIQVQSQLGKGSEFTLVLPQMTLGNSIQPDLYSLNDTLIETQFASTEFPKKTKTLLLVEDSEPMVIQLQDILETAGYHLLIARNGKEALDSVSNTIPDAMILDLLMPEIDGFEVLRQIRENPSTHMLPVMIMTSKYISKEELYFLKNNGIYQLIRKGGILRDPLLKEVHKMILTGPESTQKPIHENPGRKILIVEDNPDNVLTIQALIGEDFEVVVAGNGLDGVSLAIQEKPDLILMDIALPIMNGAEAMRKIKQNPETKHIPVVVVSASALVEDKDNFLSQGFDGYISKPIDSTLFEELLRKIFD